MLLLLTVLKVREEQEKRREEELKKEELQSQLQSAQQPGQQSSTEMPQSQPVPSHVSYVPPQPNQHSTQPLTQPASQQSLQGSNYNTPQSSQLTGLTQGSPYVPQSTVQVPVQGQSVVTIKPESEEPEADQQLFHAGGGMYQRSFVVACQTCFDFKMGLLLIQQVTWQIDLDHPSFLMPSPLSLEYHTALLPVSTFRPSCPAHRHKMNKHNSSSCQW